MRRNRCRSFISRLLIRHIGPHFLVLACVCRIVGGAGTDMTMLLVLWHGIRRVGIGKQNTKSCYMNRGACVICYLCYTDSGSPFGHSDGGILILVATGTTPGEIIPRSWSIGTERTRTRQHGGSEHAQSTGSIH